MLGAVGAHNNKVTQRNDSEHADIEITRDGWQAGEGEARNFVLRRKNVQVCTGSMAFLRNRHTREVADKLGH